MSQPDKAALGASFRQNRRMTLLSAAAGAVGFLGAGVLPCATAQAQEQQKGADAAAAWPQRPVRVVVPYAPGGSADTLGRLIALHLQTALKQSFVIDNRGGAGGVIGSQQVAKSAPDGYTLVVSGIGSHVIAPVENKAYNPVTDFTHIALLGGPPTVLVVHPSTPANSARELVAYAKQAKEGLSWGSPGQGTHGHLLGELFGRAAGINQTHIGYKGAGPAMSDLLSGQIPAAFMTLTSANAQMKLGTIKALAVTSEKRLTEFPDLPTFAELGYPKLTSTTWFSLSGPSGMPAAIVDKLNAEVRRGLKTAAVKKTLAQEGIETHDWDPATFTNFVRSEVDRWQPLAQSLNKPRTQ